MDSDGLVLEERGSWDAVVEFAEAVAVGMRATERISERDCERFEDWIPSHREEEQTVEERTVEHETLSETDIEQRSDGSRTELMRAENAMERGGRDLLHGHPRATARDVEEAGRSTARGILPTLFRMFRRVERVLYRFIVGRANPEFFEGETVTASLAHGLWRRGRFRFRVQFSSRETVAAVEEAMWDG